MSKNILLCGVGGQGTVLASKLLCAAAMKKGIEVKSAETIGMAQRGGSVFSHVKLGEAHSSLLHTKSAHIIIGFEPGETVRMLPYLKEGGTCIVSARSVMPVTAFLQGFSYDGGEMLSYLKRNVKNLIIIDPDKAIADLKNPKVLNMVLLGAAVHTGILPVSADDIKEAIKERVKPQFHQLNFEAIDYSERNK